METIIKFNPMSIFLIIVVVSTFNAGLLLLSGKWGITDYYIAHRKKWMPEHCEFCVCFWLAAIELSALYFYCFSGFDLYLFLMVFVFSLCSAVISRFVL